MLVTILYTRDNNHTKTFSLDLFFHWEVLAVDQLIEITFKQKIMVAKKKTVKKAAKKVVKKTVKKAAKKAPARKKK